MNTQLKSKSLPNTASTPTFCGLGFLILLGFILSGFFRSLSALELPNLAEPASTSCQQIADDVNGNIKTRMPINPDVAQTILNLRREGNELCRQGDHQAGQAKLQQARALFDLNVLPADTTKP